MPDMFGLQKRSEIMSKIHSSNTTPEIRVRKLLHGMGYRFRLQKRDLPGNPNIVLPKYTLLTNHYGVDAVNIEIDLDDGVKRNYEIFADVLAKI
jgi:DNA mismatch endonuclease Vsr